jgi:RNA polymerase sigma factor (sigma-70 family)
MPDDDLGEYRGYLMVLARCMVPYDLRPVIDPSDLVQDTICAALVKPDALEPDVRFWLRRKLHDIFVVRYRQLVARPPVISLDDPLDDTDHTMSVYVADHRHGPLSDLVLHEKVLRLADSLLKLPERQCEAIVLQYFAGMSVKDICRRMNATPAAVGGLLRHGKQGLRDLITRED